MQAEPFDTARQGPDRRWKVSSDSAAADLSPNPVPVATKVRFGKAAGLRTRPGSESPGLSQFRLAQGTETSRTSRFSRLEFPRMHRVFDSAAPRHDSPSTPRCVLPSPRLDKVGTRNLLMSELHGWPACTPSSCHTRDVATPGVEVGAEWLAKPCSYDSFIRYSRPVHPGAFPISADPSGHQDVLELFGGQAFVAEPAVEALRVAVLPRRPRFDVQGLHFELRKPAPNRLGDELRAVVAADVHGHAPHRK